MMDDEALVGGDTTNTINIFNDDEAADKDDEVSQIRCLQDRC